MKKSVKKLAALGLTTVSVVNLVACGSSESSGSKSSSGEVTKPEKFSVMVNCHHCRRNMSMKIQFFI